MPRGIERDALANAGNNQGQASTAYNTLAPLYSRMATNPQGYTPQQMANFNTASQQSAGGGVAAAVGQGGLMAARTNNAGGYQAALDDASRNAIATNSGNALGVQNQDADLMLKQQAMGLAGEQNLYDTSTQAGLSYLNTADQASQATTAANMGWTKIAGNFLRPGSQS